MYFILLAHIWATVYGVIGHKRAALAVMLLWLSDIYFEQSGPEFEWKTAVFSWSIPVDRTLDASFGSPFNPLYMGSPLILCTCISIQHVLPLKDTVSLVSSAGFAALYGSCLHRWAGVVRWCQSWTHPSRSVLASFWFTLRHLHPPPTERGRHIHRQRKTNTYDLVECFSDMCMMVCSVCMCPFCVCVFCCVCIWRSLVHKHCYCNVWTANVHWMWWTFNYWTYFTYLFRSYWNKREPLYSSITVCVVSGDFTWEGF